MIVSQATVLLICDDAEFARRLLGEWEGQADAPAFVVLASAADPQTVAGFDLAVVAHVPDAALSSLLPMVDRGRPVLCVVRSNSVAALRRAHSGCTFAVAEAGAH